MRKFIEINRKNEKHLINLYEICNIVLDDVILTVTFKDNNGSAKFFKESGFISIRDLYELIKSEIDTL